MVRELAKFAAKSSILIVAQYDTGIVPGSVMSVPFSMVLYSYSPELAQTISRLKEIYGRKPLGKCITQST